MNAPSQQTNVRQQTEKETKLTDIPDGRIYTMPRPGSEKTARCGAVYNQDALKQWVHNMFGCPLRWVLLHWYTRIQLRYLENAAMPANANVNNAATKREEFKTKVKNIMLMYDGVALPPEKQDPKNPVDRTSISWVVNFDSKKSRQEREASNYSEDKLERVMKALFEARPEQVILPIEQKGGILGIKTIKKIINTRTAKLENSSIASTSMSPLAAFYENTIRQSGAFLNAGGKVNATTCYKKEDRISVDPTWFSSRLVAQSIFDYALFMRHKYLAELAEYIFVKIVPDTFSTINIALDGSTLLNNLTEPILREFDYHQNVRRTWRIQGSFDFEQQANVGQTQANAKILHRLEHADYFTGLAFMESFLLSIPNLVITLQKKVDAIFGSISIKEEAENAAARVFKANQNSNKTLSRNAYNTFKNAENKLKQELIALYTETEQSVRSQLALNSLLSLFSQANIKATMKKSYDEFINTHGSNLMDVAPFDIPHDEYTYEFLVQYFKTKPIMFMRVVVADHIEADITDHFQPNKYGDNLDEGAITKMFNNVKKIIDDAMTKHLHEKLLEPAKVGILKQLGYNVGNTRARKVQQTLPGQTVPGQTLPGLPGQQNSRNNTLQGQPQKSTLQGQPQNTQIPYTIKNALTTKFPELTSQLTDKEFTSLITNLQMSSNNDSELVDYINETMEKDELERVLKIKQTGGSRRRRPTAPATRRRAPATRPRPTTR
jgi:hypothetical protein